MNNYNPLMLLDYYKSTHWKVYPQGLTKMVSYYTPRMSRLKDVDKLVMFGLQGYIKTYLIDGFNKNFFSRPKEEVLAEYDRIFRHTLVPSAYNVQMIADLHDLGYLPLEISAVPEGMSTKMGVPQIQITNTHPDFIWLVNTIETQLSCSMWHAQVSAEVGRRYRYITNYWVGRTCDDDVNPANLIGDFSMRGQHSVESAILSSTGWLLSHNNTATVPAIMYMEDNYNCNIENEVVGKGAISTEHSVMCSNYAVDGDEITHIRRLLTEIYPNSNFSMVSDSYDYWNLVTNLLPQIKDEIMAHNGTLLIRGDSGNPVEIIAGKNIVYLSEKKAEKLLAETADFMDDWSFYKEDKFEQYFCCGDKIYLVIAEPEWGEEEGAWSGCDHSFIDHWDYEVIELPMTAEIMGTVWALDQIVGHTVNSKGYKVLDPHLRAIYGDSILPDYADEIYKRLAAQGYAANNVILGAGSMSMMALVCADETRTKLIFAGEVEGTNPGPYTRDTFGIAVKATYAEDADGNPIMIHKQPKALSWKKSQKGCCWVSASGENYTDELTWDELQGVNEISASLIQPVFRDGKMIKEYTLAEIRKNMWS